MKTTTTFPLAFPVHDLAQARRFYGDMIGCTEHLSASDWVDFDFYGQQIVALLSADGCEDTRAAGWRHVPLRRFGTVLPLAQWHALAERLQRARVGFLVEPHFRHRDGAAEQATMAVLDPFGNGLELTAFAGEAHAVGAILCSCAHPI